MAHAFVDQPPSRDTGIVNLDARSHKTGPCGGSPRGAMPTQYQPGQTIPVKFKETISHQGCFQIRFSPANDDNWVTLKQVDDPAGPANNVDTDYTEMVTLPNTPCKDCTLQVLQLMLGRACVANEPPPAGNTYFSCADIRVGDFPDAGPTMPPADGGTGEEDSGTSSGGVSTTPTDGGGKTGNGASPGSRKLTPVDSGDDGCNVGWGATSGFSLFASAGLALLAVARRRRRS
jgi:hypothetical protein